MGPCGLQHVCALQQAAQGQVSLEGHQDQGWEVVTRHHAKLDQTV